MQDTSHLVTYLATFLLPGNGCHHRVLVFPLMGPCLNWVILRDMPMATRMSAARQLLEAVEIYTKLGLYTVVSNLCLPVSFLSVCILISIRQI